MKYLLPIILLYAFFYSCASSTTNSTMATDTNSITIDEGVLHPVNGHNISIQYISTMDYKDKDGHQKEGLAASLVVTEEGRAIIVGQSSTFELGSTTYLVTDIQATGDGEFDNGFIKIEAQ